MKISAGKELKRKIVMDAVIIKSGSLLRMYCFKDSAPERIIIQPGGRLEFSNNENFVYIDVTKGRKKAFRNLKPEVMYYFYSLCSQCKRGERTE